MPLTHRRFTVDEFHRMAETGILREDDRVELLDGEIVEMTPIGPRHAGCVNAITALLAPAVPRVLLTVQNPVVLGRHQELYPDLAVVRPRPDAYRAGHPGPDDVLLVVEVADTSVETDRDGRIPRYAEAGITEAWLVNLPDDVLEVYREPRDGLYRLRRIVRRGEVLTPLALPRVELTADEILG